MVEHSLLVDAAIYLLAAVAFVVAASRMGLGSVIGYLIAGFIGACILIAIARAIKR